MLTYWCETSKFSFHWNKNQLENLECAKAGSFYLPLFTFVYLCLLLLLFQIFETKDRGTKSQIGTVPLSCISKIWNTIKEFTFFHNPKSITVGVITNETLVLVNFSAQDASILKISVPINKRRSWGFQNTPCLQSLVDFWPSYGSLKKSFPKSWSYSTSFKIQVNL